MKQVSIIFSLLFYSISVFSQSGNTATGDQALNSNTTGSGNTASGYHALNKNATGSYNSAFGYAVLSSNYSGEFNTVTGSFSLHKGDLSQASGSHNTADGSNISNCCYTLQSFSVGVGYSALWNIDSSGNNSTAIGFGATGNGYNSTAIGSFSDFTINNNAVRISNGTNSSNSIGGFVAWSNLSDARTKKNIRQNVPGLAFIKKLQPVTYNLDLDVVDSLLQVGRSANMPSLSKEEKTTKVAQQKRVYTGFVAQDVEKANQSIGYDFSGVDIKGGVYALCYSDFVMPLVKAVQEISEENNVLHDQVNKLTVEVNQLLERKSKRSAAITQH